MTVWFSRIKQTEPIPSLCNRVVMSPTDTVVTENINTHHLVMPNASTSPYTFAQPDADVTIIIASTTSTTTTSPIVTSTPTFEYSACPPPPSMFATLVSLRNEHKLSTVCDSDAMIVCPTQTKPLSPERFCSQTSALTPVPSSESCPLSSSSSRVLCSYMSTPVSTCDIHQQVSNKSMAVDVFTPPSKCDSNMSSVRYPVPVVHATSNHQLSMTILLMLCCLTNMANGVNIDQYRNFDPKAPPLSHYKQSTQMTNNNNNDDLNVKLNQYKLRMINQLRNQHPTPYLVSRQQTRLNEPIFDPNMEELLIESYDIKQNLPKIMAKPYRDMKELFNVDDIVEEEMRTNEGELESDKNVNNDDDVTNMVDSKQWSDDGKLSLGDEHNFLKNVIKSGWIEHSSTKTLLYFLKKVNFLLSNDGEHSSEPNIDLDLPEPMLSKDEDLLMATGNKENDTSMDRSKSKNKDSVDELNKNFIETHKNIEIVLDRLMSTPNVVKKRGEGPQLSIDSPLTVLRHRLIVELARREAEKTEKQIAINTEILRKLGRRRRRRSVPEAKTKRTTKKNCTGRNCKFGDLKWTTEPQLFYVDTDKPKGNKNRFRNNDKLISFDKLFNAEDKPTDGLAYSATLTRTRVNSKKPSSTIQFGNIDVLHATSVPVAQSQSPNTINRYWTIWQQFDNQPTRYRYPGAAQSPMLNKWKSNLM